MNKALNHMTSHLTMKCILKGIAIHSRYRCVLFVSELSVEDEEDGCKDLVHTLSVTKVLVFTGVAEQQV